MKRIIAFLLALVLLLGMTACSDKKPSSGNAGGSSSVENTANGNGHGAFDTVVSGNDVTLVAVLASWSTPCETVIPTLQTISKDMKKVGVVGIIADAVDETTFAKNDDVMQYVADLMAGSEADFTVVAPDKELYAAFCESTEYFPTSYIVNSKGEIIAPAIIAAGDADSFIAELNTALKAATAEPAQTTEE